MLNIEESKQFDIILREYCDISDRVVMDFVIEARKDEDGIGKGLVNRIYDMMKKSLSNISSIADKSIGSTKSVDEEIKKIDKYIEESEKNNIKISSKIIKIFNDFKSSYNKVKNSIPLAVKGFFMIFSYMMTTSVLYCLLLSFLVSISAAPIVNLTILVGFAITAYACYVKMIIHFVNKMPKTEPIEESVAAVIGVPTAVLLFTQIVPFLKEGLYFIYYMDVKLSDGMKALADTVEMNALKLKASKEKDPEKKAAIIKKQEAIANSLKSISNKFNFVEANQKKAKNAAKNDKSVKIDREIVEELKKANSNDVISI